MADIFSHDHRTDLNLINKELKSVLGIKLTRTRERHASAMGFNTQAHLVAEISAKNKVSIALNDYFDKLESDLQLHHQIELTPLMKSSISSIAEKHEPSTSSEKMYYYIGWFNNDEDDEPCDLPVIDVDIAENLYLKPDDDFDFEIDINSKNKAVHLYDLLEHGGCINLGLTVLLTKTEMPLSFKSEQGQCFHYLDSESVDFDDFNDSGEGETDRWRSISDFDDECYFEWFIIPILNKNEKIAKILKTEQPILRLKLSKEDLWLPTARENDLDFQYIEDEIEYELYNPTLTITSTGAELSISPLSSMFVHEPSTEMLEAYINLPWRICSNPIIKFLKTKTFKVNSADDDHHIVRVSDYLWAEALRESDNSPINQDERFEGKEKDLFQIFEQYNIKTIESYALIGHNMGDEIILGCIGIDNHGLERIRFQLDAFSCSELHHEFLPKLKDLGIAFNVQQDTEFSYKCRVVDTEGYYYETFMHPEYSAPSYCLGFLIFQTEQRNLPNRCVDLNEHPKVLAMGIQAGQRDVTILPPMHFPLDTEMWHKTVTNVINSQYKNGKTSNPDLTDAIKKEMEPRCTNNTSIVCAPMIFHCTESEFENVMWNCSILYNNLNGGKLQELGQGVIKPLEDALGLKPIENFMFKIIKK